MQRNHFASPRRRAAIFIGIVVAGVLAACTEGTRSSAPPPVAAAINGRIAAREGATLLVVAPTPPVSGYDRASVRLHEGTRVLRASGAPASADDLRVGQGVRVWFDGPVMESYPVQSSAGTVVIDTEADGTGAP
jgi:hypothetical protein